MFRRSTPPGGLTGLARCVLVAIAVIGATLPAAAAGADPSLPHRMEAEHLPNPVRLHPRVVSGGLPEGDAAFAELRDLGFRTLISVDGMKPDVAAARRHGLRYVHLPHGYNGVPERRANELAKALTELDGPFYIHCHHGQHRSPAAASVACVAAGLLPQSLGVAILDLAGTSPHYRGLYSAARNARRIDPALLATMTVDFPEVAEPPPMVEAMVAMERSIERLSQLAEAGWRSPADHPDLDPAHEALLLREHFTELLRADCIRREPAELVELLRASERTARELEGLLLDGTTESTNAAPSQAAAAVLTRVRADCTACHERFRDTPLGAR